MNRIESRLVKLAVLMTILVSSNSVMSEETKSPSPTENALDSSIWFDPERQEIVPVTLVPQSDDSLNRDSRWLPKAKRVKQAAGPVAPATGLFGTGYTIANILAWALVIIIAIAIIGFLAFVVSKTETPETVLASRQNRASSDLPDAQMVQRMNHLPAELRRTDVNLRSEAERLMKTGNYDHAIILLYGHQLLLLDHVGMLRLNRGKTNRKYLGETAAADSESAKRLRATVDAFERSYFGRHSISEAEFKELWQSNTDLENSVQKSPEVAA